MPELPEVETIRRQLCEAGVEGRTIETLSILWPRTVDPLTPEEFQEQVVGRVIERVSRHGKWLILELDGIENLLIHLRMTGGFYLSQGELEPGKHDRAILQLSDGLNMHFRDPRKFGRWRLAVFPKGLGPDALELGAKYFFSTMENTSRKIKVLLLDQSFIAGVGNIYADEALFAASIHPERPAKSLTDAEMMALYDAVTSVLRASVENGGTSLGDGQGNYTDLNGESGGFREKAKAYGRAGQPCLTCGEPMSKIVVAQRGTVFCSNCQK